MSSDETFWNEEDETFIKCPYCGAEYEPPVMMILVQAVKV